jgi:Tfp pilus assembly protein PilF
VKNRALESHFNTGMIALREGEHAAAEKSFRRCLVMNPKHAASFVKLGNLQMAQGHPRRGLNPKP